MVTVDDVRPNFPQVSVNKARTRPNTKSIFFVTASIISAGYATCYPGDHGKKQCSEIITILRAKNLSPDEIISHQMSMANVEIGRL